MKTKGKSIYHISQLFIVAVFVLSATSHKPLSAIPEYASVLPTDLKRNCNVCHESNAGGSLNPFGEDYVRFDFDLLMDMDSDSDGYSNGDELDAGKLPGDAESYPGTDDQNTLLLMGGSVLIISGAVLIYFKFIKK